MVKDVTSLINTDDPGVDLVREWIADAENQVQELPVERAAGERALYALQVTSRSPMGAIALETGGLLVDHGFIRVLGGGHAQVRAIQDWNGIVAGQAGLRLPGAILVADDVVGGFFAVNGGGLRGDPGHIFYFSPTSLEWEDVGDSYSEWLCGLFDGDLSEFYDGMRWDGWEKDAAALSGSHAFSIYPFLCTEGPTVAERSRRAVPIAELWGLHVEELPKQLSR